MLEKYVLGIPMFKAESGVTLTLGVRGKGHVPGAPAR